MLRSLCLILFLCCVLVAGAFPGTGRAQTDALPHLEQIAVRGKTSVASCLDGDTMQLTNRSRVRLAGIDTPELKPRKGKPQFYAREARELLTRLARGQEVRFFAVDKEGKDKYGRIVADVRLKDGRSLNGIMVREGAAFFYPHKGLDKEYQDWLLGLQAEAIKERRGMWAEVLSRPEALKNYTGNRNSLRFFPADCPDAQKMKPRNRHPFRHPHGCLHGRLCPGPRLPLLAGGKIRSCSISLPFPTSRPWSSFPAARIRPPALPGPFPGFARVHTLGFDYGQRHSVELECRGKVRSAIAALKPEWQDRLGPDTLLDISLFRQLADTALTSDMPIEQEGEGIPNTFVPGRNLLFIMHAAAWAYGKNIRHLVLGVCESDSSGYPDCRDDSIKAMQVALNTGMDSHFVLHTPLMWLDKADTWRLAEDLGGMPLVDCILEQSHTCYEGTRGERYPWGYGCGQCPACKLRAHGYEVYLSRYHQK